MKSVLLDTNIVIYLLKGEPDAVKFMESYVSSKWHISIVTWIEVLIGAQHHKKTIRGLERDIADFSRLPLTESIGRKTAQLCSTAIRKNKKIKQFQDSIIAATAFVHKIPLITNNPRHFRQFKGLRLISPR